MRKIILGGFLFLGMFVFSGCGNQPATVADDSAIILFYGEECPHCKVVEKYVADNNIKAKVTFSEREVNHDKANANLMVEKQRSCKLDGKSVGAVPFLFTAEKCYLGQDEIINFFKDKSGAQ
jgi:glutaredoxin